mgnify:CR=1 FL=1
MGFDNIDVLKYIHPNLSTVSYPLKELGVIVVDSIINLINGNEIETDIYLNHSIIRGLTL